MTSACVLGCALRTAAGATVDEVVARVLAGERVDGRVARIRAPTPESKHARFLGRLPVLALAAAHEACASAAVTGGERLGVFVGVGGLRVEWDELAPALANQAPDGAAAWQRGLHRIHPFWMLRHLSNNAHALLAADVDARGDGASFGGATAGAQAIAAAARALAARTIDTAVVLAYDSLLGPETIADLQQRGALATDPLDDARVIPGEGAAAIVLARADTARAQVSALACADGSPAEPTAGTVARALAGVADGAATDIVYDGSPLARATGAIGAATAVVQTIVLEELLRRRCLPTAARAAVCASTGAPGLAAAVRVEVPR